MSCSINIPMVIRIFTDMCLLVKFNSLHCGLQCLESNSTSNQLLSALTFIFSYVMNSRRWKRPFTFGKMMAMAVVKVLSVAHLCPTFPFALYNYWLPRVCFCPTRTRGFLSVPRWRLGLVINHETYWSWKTAKRVGFLALLCIFDSFSTHRHSTYNMYRWRVACAYIVDAVDLCTSIWLVLR